MLGEAYVFYHPQYGGLRVIAYCLPLEKPMDIRYTADGLYINGMRIN